MAHKIGLSDTQPEPDDRDEVDLGIDEHASDFERTRGVAVSCVIGSSSLASASGLEDSRYRCVEDTSSVIPRASRSWDSEGQEGEGEVRRQGDSGQAVSSDPHTTGNVGSASSIEAQQQPSASAVMERVDLNAYSSDDWEESDLSDTDGDHSDSSDDDDPKSQVDRLIDQVTLVYLDGENSNLSSDSSDSSDYDDSDSESDITDVSPLISATASPLGLSPVLPRRTLGTSPLALHDNRDLGFGFHHHHHGHHPESSSNDQGYDSQPPNCNGHSNSDDSTDMSLLLQAVVDLEEKQRRQNSLAAGNGGLEYHHQHESSPAIAIHPIHASPHHRHLRRSSHHHRRKNMSFSNEEVRRIDRENQILLQKIMHAHSRTSHNANHRSNHSTNSHHHTSSSHHHTSSSRPVHRPANATFNRKREDEKIRRENMILLRKIQEAKPSRDVAAFRSPRHRATHSLRPTSSLAPPPGSCGASARTAPGHVPTPRKETAL